MSDLQERLLSIRKSTQLSQAGFGATLGVSDRAYKNYELGIRELPLAIALDLAEKYDVGIGWLLTGKEAPSEAEAGDAVEAAALAVREHFVSEGYTPSPDHEAKVIRYVFEEILRDGGINRPRLAAYFRTLRKE